MQLGIYSYECLVCQGKGLVPDIDPRYQTMCPYCNGTGRVEIEVVTPDEEKDRKDDKDVNSRK